MTHAPFKPRPGFDWGRVAWGRPDSPRRPLCSYCAGKIGEDDVPLMLWKDDGSMAQFCDRCVERWFGGEPAPRPDKTEDRPYTIGDNGSSITCHRCGRTSHNSRDVDRRYCGHCHLFLDDEAGLTE